MKITVNQYRKNKYLAFYLLLNQITGLNWQAEYKFLTNRKFRFDFACVEKKIAIEINGGNWINGRHSTGIGLKVEYEKFNLAVSEGWRILQFLPEQLKDKKIIEIIVKITS